VYSSEIRRDGGEKTIQSQRTSIRGLAETTIFNPNVARMRTCPKYIVVLFRALGGVIDSDQLPVGSTRTNMLKKLKNEPHGQLDEFLQKK